MESLVSSSCNILSKFVEGGECKMMKSTGIVRKVDELGRVVLPIELRRTLGIDEKDALEIYVDREKIILKKYEPACVFCSNADDVQNFKGKNICRECLTAMANQAG
jgi:transcriptional pleiotropic regulator of transition state genes